MAEAQKNDLFDDCGENEEEFVPQQEPAAESTEDQT